MQYIGNMVLKLPSTGDSVTRGYTVVYYTSVIKLIIGYNRLTGHFHWKSRFRESGRNRNRWQAWNLTMEDALFWLLFGSFAASGLLKDCNWEFSEIHTTSTNFYLCSSRNGLLTVQQSFLWCVKNSWVPSRTWSRKKLVLVFTTVWILWMSNRKWNNSWMGNAGQCGPIGPSFHFLCDIHHIHTVDERILFTDPLWVWRLSAPLSLDGRSRPSTE